MFGKNKVRSRVCIRSYVKVGKIVLMVCYLYSLETQETDGGLSSEIADLVSLLQRRDKVKL
jgi:hypothetical protein